MMTSESNGKMIERQVIATWYTPEKKLPEEDIAVVATVSGDAGNCGFEHAVIIMYYCKDEGWYSLDIDFKWVTVHAWCDLEPYKG